jgi:NAD(P)-dependent dehydrogenase (short-subunit alcohol dehydrogenase family)
MKPLSEQVIMVTGSTDGIGKLTAIELAKKGATVLLHGRSEERGRNTLREVRDTTGNKNVEFYLANLSSLQSVRQLAKEVAANYSCLDVLINNAGVLGKRDDPRMLSKEGYELHFAVNHLAPFLLTQLLLPLLRNAAPSRIVNVSSTAQQPIDFDDVMMERNFDALQAYAQSKLALVMFTIDLAEKLKDDQITVNALHPGSLLDTKMVRNTFGNAWGSAQSGADAVFYLATSPDLTETTGAYFDQQEQTQANGQAYEDAARQKLWKLSEQLTNTAFGG